jgi:Tfp pilus assembly protein PilO
MTRKTFSSREVKIFVVMMALCSTFGLYRGLYLPFYEKGELIKARILKKQKELTQQRRAVQKVKMGDSRIEELLKDFRQVDSDEKVMSAVLSEIEEVANGIGMRIADMKPRRTRATDFYNQFSVSLALDGPLADIMRFLYQLENPPHLFYVEEMSLSKISPRGAELRCQLVLSRLMIP